MTQTKVNADTVDEVVLLDEQGVPIGTQARAAVHGRQTPLHLAFSVHLRDERGQVLLTRRALSKVAWPGVWTNSCCGHPQPGEAVDNAVLRRVDQELGCSISGLRLVLPAFRYRAVDASGIVENEVCPVYVAEVRRGDLRPDPGEVAEHTWVEWPDAVAAASAMPRLLSPWSVLQWQQLGPADPWAQPAGS